jgi:cell division septation protein DedD
MPITAQQVREGKRVRIHVTAADIETAVRRDSRYCPIAAALARAIPDAFNIRVSALKPDDPTTIAFSIEEERYTYIAPWAADNFAVGFDNGETPEPFTFALGQKPKITARTGHGRKPAAGPAPAVEGAGRVTSKPEPEPASTSKPKPPSKPEPEPASTSKPKPPSKPEPEPASTSKPKRPSKPTKGGARAGAGRPRQTRSYGHRRNGNGGTTAA